MYILILSTVITQYTENVKNYDFYHINYFGTLDKMTFLSFRVYVTISLRSLSL